MLKTKLTALCAALLLGVAFCLSAAMLWQVREQAYGSLLQNSEETLEDLLSNFDAPAFRAAAFPAAPCWWGRNACMLPRPFTRKAIWIFPAQGFSPSGPRCREGIF